MRTPAASSVRRLALTLALGAFLASVPSARAGDAPAGVAGMRVYRDPATGAFVPPPAAPAPAATPAGAQPLGARRFVEVQGTSPAGGVTVDLQGAFQSEVTATVDPAGRVTTHCADTPAAR
ncbi:MAG TPA: hypothetical protein VGK30_12865 [Candidatus Binatia bacterium]|jgi:hypothetical protein